MLDKSASPLLRDVPDWSAAAQVLINGCAQAGSAAQRVDFVERLCGVLGTQLYPAFLKVLCLIGERGTDSAQACVAEALVDGLLSGRIPSARRAPWGAAGLGVKHAQRSSAAGLGPIEFLCAWQTQPNDADVLGAVAFDGALRTVLHLVSHSEHARGLYCARLIALADDPLGGTLARGTRSGLRALATCWQQSRGDMQAPVDAFLGALGTSGLQSLRVTPPTTSQR